MSAEQLRKIFREMHESKDWPAIKAAMEAENERFVELGEGDDTWERIMIEIASETYTSTDSVEDWAPEKIRSMVDAILRKRGSSPELMDTHDAKIRLGTKSDKTFQTWMKKAKAKSVGRGKWRRSDVETARNLRRQNES
jgi:hypothetical protein